MIPAKITSSIVDKSHIFSDVKRSLLDFAFPHYKINQHRDETDGDEGEGDDQLLRSIHQRKLVGAVMEVG